MTFPFPVSHWLFHNELGTTTKFSRSSREDTSKTTDDFLFKFRLRKWNTCKKHPRSLREDTRRQAEYVVSCSDKPVGEERGGDQQTLLRGESKNTYFRATEKVHHEDPYSILWGSVRKEEDTVFTHPLECIRNWAISLLSLTSMGRLRRRGAEVGGSFRRARKETTGGRKNHSQTEFRQRRFQDPLGIIRKGSSE